MVWVASRYLIGRRATLSWVDVSLTAASVAPGPYQDRTVTVSMTQASRRRLPARTVAELTIVDGGGSLIAEPPQVPSTSYGGTVTSQFSAPSGRP